MTDRYTRRAFMRAGFGASLAKHLGGNAAVQFARANELKVVARTGGHNFCGSFLRDESVLVDVSRLQSLDIDLTTRRVSVQPSGRLAADNLRTDRLPEVVQVLESRLMNAPNLTVLDAKYLRVQLRNFARSVRGGPSDYFGWQMQGRSNALPDDDAMRDVAPYVQSLPRLNSTPSLHDDPQLGRKLYEQCASCHGAGGEGNPRQDAPRLAGASDWYLARQLRNFRSGIRGGRFDDLEGSRMRPFATALSEDGIVNLVTYISTLQ